MVAQGGFTGGRTGRFEIRRRLGEGGMGVVYEAFDRERETVVALKTLRHVDARSLIRFKREFRALQDIEHPNLVRLGELIEDSGELFFTMELIEGPDLVRYVRGVPEASGARIDINPSADTLRSERIALAVAPERVSYDAGRLRSCIAQLSQALAAIHDAGMVHRDVKPTNIKVTHNGRVVLLDFGLVTETLPERRSTVAHAVGTAEYMAPEQAACKPVTPASDWYSVGVILYEILTGRLPFRGSSVTIMMAKQEHSPPPPRELAPKTALDLDSLCRRLLLTAPEQRPTGQQILDLCGVSPALPISRISSQFTQSAPFVGRDKELAELMRAFVDSIADGPVMMFVHGESGMGKSELVNRFSDELALQHPNAVFLGGRCYERESLSYKAFDGVADALSRYMARLPDNEAAQLLPRRADLIAQLFPVMKRVEVIASAPSTNAPGQRRDPHEQRALMFNALRELLSRLCDRRPVVLFIDDLQWSDADSLTLLGELLHPDDPPRLLLICAVRSSVGSDHDENWIPGAERFQGDLRHVTLRELPEDKVYDLVAALAPQLARQDDVVDAIRREAGRHPLFILELVRRIEEEGLQDGSGIVNLEDALWSRVKRMPAEARAVLEIIAVAGAPIAREVVAAAARQEYAEFERAVSLLRIAVLARSGGMREADTIEACHDRIRDAVLARLDDDSRRSHHERIAIALERLGADRSDPQSLVVHLEASGQAERAAQYAEEAGQRAESALAFDRAAELYGKALHLSARDAESLRPLRLRLAQALVNAGRGAEAAEIFLEAADGADLTTRLDCQREAAEQLLLSGHVERGLDAVAGLLGEAGEVMPSSPRRALVAVIWGRFKVRLRGLAWKERHVREIADADLTRLDVYTAVAHGLALVDTVRGADYQARGLLLSLRTGEPHGVGRAFLTEAVYQASQGPRRFARGAKFLELGREVAERINDEYLRGYALTVQGTHKYFAGRLREALPLLRESEAIMRAIPGANWELSTTRLFHIYVLRVRGALNELRTCAEEYLRDAIRRGDRYMDTTIRRCFNIAWLARDQVAESNESLERASWMPPEGVFHLQHWYETEARGELALYSGTVEQVRPELDEKFRALGKSLLLRIVTTRLQSIWLAGRLALACGDPLQKVERRARRLAKEGVAYADVWSRLLTAAVAHQRGKADSAAQNLRQAASIADDHDMPLCAACARLRLAEILDGPEAERVGRQGSAWMEAEGVVRPDRMLAVVAPGFGTAARAGSA